MAVETDARISAGWSRYWNCSAVGMTISPPGVRPDPLGREAGPTGPVVLEGVDARHLFQEEGEDEDRYGAGDDGGRSSSRCRSTEFLRRAESTPNEMPMIVSMRHGPERQPQAVGQPLADHVVDRLAGLVRLAEVERDDAPEVLAVLDVDRARRGRTSSRSPCTTWSGSAPGCDPPARSSAGLLGRVKNSRNRSVTPPQTTKISWRSSAYEEARSREPRCGRPGPSGSDGGILMTNDGGVAEATPPEVHRSPTDAGDHFLRPTRCHRIRPSGGWS